MLRFPFSALRVTNRHNTTARNISIWLKTDDWVSSIANYTETGHQTALKWSKQAQSQEHHLIVLGDKHDCKVPNSNEEAQLGKYMVARRRVSNGDVAIWPEDLLLFERKESPTLMRCTRVASLQTTIVSHDDVWDWDPSADRIAAGAMWMTPVDHQLVDGSGALLSKQLCFEHTKVNDLITKLKASHLVKRGESIVFTYGYDGPPVPAEQQIDEALFDKGSIFVSLEGKGHLPINAGLPLCRYVGNTSAIVNHPRGSMLGDPRNVLDKAVGTMTKAAATAKLLTTPRALANLVGLNPLSMEEEEARWASLAVDSSVTQHSSNAGEIATEDGTLHVYRHAAIR